MFATPVVMTLATRTSSAVDERGFILCEFFVACERGVTSRESRAAQSLLLKVAGGVDGDRDHLMRQEGERYTLVCVDTHAVPLLLVRRPCALPRTERGHSRPSLGVLQECVPSLWPPSFSALL